MDFVELGYLGLFGGSFLAATIIPFPSEGLLVGFFELDFHIWWCLGIATVGNTLGGMTNYFIGRFGSSKRVMTRFKRNPENLEKWNKRSQKYGHWLGLLAWLPIVGDPMLIALGFLKSKLWPLFLTVLIGKFARYLVLTWIYLGLFG